MSTAVLLVAGILITAGILCCGYIALQLGWIANAGPNAVVVPDDLSTLDAAGPAPVEPRLNGGAR